MLMLPSRSSAGDRSQNAPATAATSATDTTRSRRVDVFTACSHDEAQHGEDAERDGRDAEAVGDVEGGGGDVPFLHHIFDGRLQHDEQERRGQDKAERLDEALDAPGNIPRNSVSLRCSFRSMAMAEPSMASQRNEIEAASSIQTTG